MTQRTTQAEETHAVLRLSDEDSKAHFTVRVQCLSAVFLRRACNRLTLIFAKKDVFLDQHSINPYVGRGSVEKIVFFLSNVVIFLLTI